jgi:hypothetical protein
MRIVERRRLRRQASSTQNEEEALSRKAPLNSSATSWKRPSKRFQTS